MALTKALLQVLEDTLPPRVKQGEENKVEAQFNPQTLTVTYSIAGPNGVIKDYRQMTTQGAKQQNTGYNATVAMDLLFDTTEDGKDVRNTTLKIAGMIKGMPKHDAGNGNKNPDDPVPHIRFSWGTFIFYGSIQSMTETLDFFSEQGVPLRATVHLTMSEIALERNDPANFTASLSLGLSASIGASAGVGFSASASLSAGIDVGTTPLTLSQAGDTIQGLADRAGASVSWKAIASANNIDNPRMIPQGTVLNVSASASLNANGSASASASASLTGQ